MGALPGSPSLSKYNRFPSSQMVPPISRIRLDAILPLVYEELRSCASRALSNERHNHTFQTTELVHETYVRLANLNEIDWDDNKDVLRAAVAVMRRVLIDYARARNAKKRDGGQILLSCSGEMYRDPASEPQPIDLLTLDVVLEKLRAIDTRKADIVELRDFGGQTIEDVAGLLGVSIATVKREWTFTRAWLHRELAGDTSGG